MRNVIAALFAAISLAGVSGCDTRAEPGNASMVRFQVDWTQDRSWWLTRDSAVLHGADRMKHVVALPGWLWAGEPFCPPDLAIGPDGEAVVTSNIVSTLWRIDPQTLAVTVHELKLDTDADKDVGFATLVYSPEHAAFFAYSEVQRSVWRIDPQLGRATKVASTDLSRARPARTGSTRGPCAELGRRLSRFAGVAG